MNNLNFIGPFNPLGYGQVSTNMLVHLSKHYEVALWPLGQISLPPNKAIELIIQRGLDNQSKFDKNAPSLRIWHQFEMAQHVGKGLHVGMPIFEMDRFDSREKHHLDSLDRVFVNSKWAKGIVDKEVPGADVRVVPLGVDRSVFYDEKPVDAEPYVFINIGKWEIRKGHDILVEAFNNAFSKDDNVELWMMNHNPFLTPQQEQEWHRLYKNSRLGDKIRILPRVQTNQEVASLMRKAHCGVFPARAEGWNLELLEMMSVGRPVITTDYSAHTEFCNAQNSNLIPINGMEEAWDGIWFKGQGEWAALDKDAVGVLTYLMSEEYKSGPTLNRPGIETAKRFSWDSSAEAAMKGLE